MIYDTIPFEIGCNAVKFLFENLSSELAFIFTTPTDLLFQFQRIQFPMKNCFSMTINKAEDR